MSDKTRELISALMDDELESGSQFVVNAMTDDAENRSLWQRYHLIGEAMRGALPERIDLSLSDRISAAIEQEAAFDAPGVQPASPLMKPVVGFAIAASVAVIAIIGVRQVSEVTGPSAVPGQTQVVASGQPDNKLRNQTNNVVPPAIPANAQTLASGQPENVLRNQTNAFPVTTTVGVSPDAKAYLPQVDAETRLNRYLLNYNEYRTNTGVQGMLPYVRIVTHEVDQ